MKLMNQRIGLDLTNKNPVVETFFRKIRPSELAKIENNDWILFSVINSKESIKNDVVLFFSLLFYVRHQNIYQTQARLIQFIECCEKVWTEVWKSNRRKKLRWINGVDFLFFLRIYQMRMLFLIKLFCIFFFLSNDIYLSVFIWMAFNGMFFFFSN